MTFFVDNNIGRNIVKGMREFGEDIVHLKDSFSDDIDDCTMLKHVGRQGLVLITKDDRIRYRSLERKAFTTYKVGAFVIRGKDMSRWEQIEQLVRNWSNIKKLAAKTKHPFLFQVPRTGSNIKSIKKLI